MGYLLLSGKDRKYGIVQVPLCFSWFLQHGSAQCTVSERDMGKPFVDDLKLCLIRDGR